MFTAANKEELDDVQAKGRHAADEAKKGAFRVKKDVSNDLSDTVDSVKEDLQDMARYAGRHVRDFANSAEESVVTKIRKDPVTSVLIAAGVGFLTSLLLRRR